MHLQRIILLFYGMHTSADPQKAIKFDPSWYFHPMGPSTLMSKVQFVTLELSTLADRPLKALLDRPVSYMADFI